MVSSMGKTVLVARLAGKDLRRRPVQAMLLMVVITAAMAAAVQGAGPRGTPPAWWLLAMVLGMLLAAAGLTAVPARAGVRRPAAEILQAETA